MRMIGKALKSRLKPYRRAMPCMLKNVCMDTHDTARALPVHALCKTTARFHHPFTLLYSSVVPRFLRSEILVKPSGAWLMPVSIRPAPGVLCPGVPPRMVPPTPEETQATCGAA